MLALALKDIYCHPAQLEPECGLDVQSVERKARTNYGKQLNSVMRAFRLLSENSLLAP
jgi:hypothetical protein